MIDALTCETIAVCLIQLVNLNSYNSLVVIFLHFSCPYLFRNNNYKFVANVQ